MNMYGAATDPMPYIFSAYLLGFVLVFGYSLWLYRDRKRVERYLNALKENHPR